MDTKYVPIITAGFVGIALSITNFIVPIRLASMGNPTPEGLSFLTRVGNVTAFLLVFVVLLGVSFWASRSLDVPREFGSLGAFTFLSAMVGYLIGLVAFVLPVVTISEEGLLVIAAFSVGSSIAVGVKFAVVVLAGAALAHFR